MAAVQKDHSSPLSRKSRLEPGVAGPWPRPTTNAVWRIVGPWPRLWCLLSQRRQWRLPLDCEPDGKKGKERGTGSIRRCALRATEVSSALVRGCTALPVLCLPIGPACLNAPPEGAAGSAGAMGASCESGELCRPRVLGAFDFFRHG